MPKPDIHWNGATFIDLAPGVWFGVFPPSSDGTCDLAISAPAGTDTLTEIEPSDLREFANALLKLADAAEPKDETKHYVSGEGLYYRHRNGHDLELVLSRDGDLLEFTPACGSTPESYTDESNPFIKISAEKFFAEAR